MLSLIHKVLAFLWALLALAAAGVLRAQGSPADSVDFRCIRDSSAAMAASNGGGRRQNLKREVDKCNERWIARPRAVTPPPTTNQPPIAGFDVAKNDTTRLVRLTSVARDPEGATLTYRWSWGDGASSTTPVTTSHTYASAGTYTITQTVTDSQGANGTASKTVTLLVVTDLPPPVTPQDSIVTPPDTGTGTVLPELPRSVPDASPKTCTRSVDVPLVANLQTYLNNAVGGDCLELQPGSEYKGTFSTPARTCTATSGWISLRTKGVLDKPGVRALPSEATTGRWAKLTQASNQGALNFGHPSCRWQIYHLNIQADPASTVSTIYYLVQLGDGGWPGGGEVNMTLATQPYDLILRRNWIHGQPNSNLVRCVVTNGIREAVVDNWIDDCHVNGFDSQAVEGWNGAGPILIENNFLAGAGENIMFGGADPADPSLTPKDITVRRNHIWKDPAWKGGPWSIKNLIELKDAQRVDFDANVVENVWAASQVGMAVVFKSSIGGDATKTYQGTTDVTFRNNIVRNAHRGLNIQGVDCSGQACTDLLVNRVHAYNNLFNGIGLSNNTQPSDGWLMLFANKPQNVAVTRNTFVGNAPGYGLVLYMAYDFGLWGKVSVLNNVLAGQSYYGIGADCPQNVGTAALNCVIGAGKWLWSGNVVSQVDGQFQAAHPAGNVYKQTIAEIGLTSDFRAPNFPGKGADITVVNAKTAGVIVAAGMTARAGARRGAAPPRPFKPTPADVAYCKAHACELTPDRR